MRRVDERGAATAFIGGATLLLFFWWAFVDGGFRDTRWLPATIFLAALLAVALISWPSLLRNVPRLALVAVLALAAATAWSFASILWAEVEADAWEGANRTLLYFVVYTLFALWPWRPREASIYVGLLVTGIAAVGLAALVHAGTRDDPLDSFIGARLAEPIGYHNAAAALFLAAFFPALALAAQRDAPPLARALLLGCSVVLLELAVVPQSRGALFTFPVVLGLFFVVVPGRLRNLVTLLPVAFLFALSLEALLDVYTAAQDGSPRAAIADARTWVLASFAAAFLAGLGMSFADRRIDLSVRFRRSAAVAVCALVAIAGVAAAIVAVERGLPGRAPDAWREFKSGYVAQDTESHFASGLGSNRYDFWRVALGEFTRSPVLGIGADNFEVPYLRRRASDEEPLYPHSLEIRALSQTGLVGAGLFAVFLVAATLACARSRRVPVAAAGLVAWSYWLAHGSADWFWEIPVLTAPALALTGLGAGLGRQPLDPPTARHRRAALAIGTLTASVAFVACAPPWLAARQIESAATVWRTDPDAAYERLRRARALNPLSDRSDLAAGAIAGRLEDWPRMRTSFERAVERNPESWFGWFELAIAASLLGRDAEALRHLARAEDLNPREEAIDEVRRQLRAGRVIDPADFDRLFRDRAIARTG